jgi:Flp pilus assembly protein TadD
MSKAVVHPLLDHRSPRECGLHASEPSGIVEGGIMFKRAVLAAVFLTLAAAPSFADARSDAKEQVEFGIRVAQRGLWREAVYRWQRAVAIDPTYAAAYNNLAIAYEHEGVLEKARQAYEKATELDPGNAMIRQNFDLFREINDRTNRRGGS